MIESIYENHIRGQVILYTPKTFDVSSDKATELVDNKHLTNHNKKPILPELNTYSIPTGAKSFEPRKHSKFINFHRYVPA